MAYHRVVAGNEETPPPQAARAENKTQQPNTPLHRLPLDAYCESHTPASTPQLDRPLGPLLPPSRAGRGANVARITLRCQQCGYYPQTHTQNGITAAASEKCPAHLRVPSVQSPEAVPVASDAFGSNKRTRRARVHAKNAKDAKDGRIAVASHLACDVRESGTTSNSERPRPACGITEPPQALAPGTKERREPSSRRYRGTVESSRASCLLLAILARFA
jgi:hypothetical protein